MPPSPEVVARADDEVASSERAEGRSLELAVAAVGAIVGYRAGLLPGGLVGVALGLALLGWWVGASIAAGATPGALLRAAWRPTWPPLVVALGLACAWVLATDDAALDVVVRGQGLAVLGGYVNWHVRVVGPGEVWAARTATPLQHLWWLGAAAQALLVALLLAVATRPRARRRPVERDPLVVVALVVGLGALAGATALAVGATDRVTATLATPGPAAALLLALAAGAAMGGRSQPTLEAVADGLRWPAAVLLGLGALVARPGTVLAAALAVLAPVLAVAVVAGWAARAPGSAAGSRGRAPVVDPWYLLVSIAVLHGTCAALAAAVLDAVVPAAAAGLVLTAGVAVATAVSAQHLSPARPDVERRLVLVPPIVVGLVVLLLSLTGAFHWTDTGPRPPTPPGIDG